MATVKVYFKENNDEDAVYVLQRNSNLKKQSTYLLCKRFRYKEPGPDGREFVVPLDTENWETDLASIPTLATWLVPKDGSHTPAALVHDAMVVKPGEGKCYIGPDVTRQEADTIFRQGMQHLGVPLLRRWMMWAAVAMATFAEEGKAQKLLVVLTAVFFGGLGLVQTLDLLDLPPLQFPGTGDDEGWTIGLPWVGDKSFLKELGLVVATDAAAVLIGIVAWGALRKGLWKVGLVGGTALLLFAFPMAVAAFAYLVYLLAETLLYVVLRNRESGAQPVNPPHYLKQRRS